jgi:hypothetical protein
MASNNYQPLQENIEDQSHQTPKRNVLLFHINPEYIRIVAYVNFWLMILFSVIVTKVFVDPELLIDNPLDQTFGYSNICLFFDFPPSRVATAIVYPFVEIPLLLYIVLNYLRTREMYLEQHRIRKWEYLLCSLFFPVSFILTMYFRMVFVVEAFEDVVGHTLGFQGLQLSLCLVAIQNYWYNKATNNVPFASKKWISLTYLFSLLGSTSIKMVLVWSIFLGTAVTTFGAVLGRIIDICWMVLAAIIPLFLAIHQRKTTEKFRIVLGDALPSETAPAA